jgi:hypothetical protein
MRSMASRAADMAFSSPLGRPSSASRRIAASDWRSTGTVIAVLADQAPQLREALERAMDEGLPQVILDGKIVPCDRCKEPAISTKGDVIDLWYSGKAHTHGGNIQAVLAPDGFPLWVSRPSPARCTTSPPPTPCPDFTGLPRPAGPPPPTPATTARDRHSHPGQAAR